MKTHDEFQNIGKKIPYQAPEGFFDHLPEKTLLRAREKEKHSQKIVFIWRSVVVAASLLAIAVLSYLIPNRAIQDIPKVVQETHHQTEQTIVQKPGLLKVPLDTIVKKEVANKPSPKVNDPESINEVLSELTDEELMQLAAMYKSDSFIEVASQ